MDGVEPLAVDWPRCLYGWLWEMMVVGDFLCCMGKAGVNQVMENDEPVHHL